MSDSTATSVAAEIGTALTGAVPFVGTITAGINLAGQVVKLTDDELAFLNSNQAVTARQAYWEQQQRDLDAQAVAKAEAGDATELEERSS